MIDSRAVHLVRKWVLVELLLMLPHVIAELASHSEASSKSLQKDILLLYRLRRR